MEPQRVQIFFQTKMAFPPSGGQSGSQEAASWESPECQAIETAGSGTYYKRGNAHYCLYEEQREGLPPSREMLKWKDGILERGIRGEATHMVFEPGKYRYCPCETPYGDMPMETDTHRLEITEARDDIMILLEYGIRREGQLCYEIRLDIRIRGMEI